MNRSSELKRQLWLQAGLSSLIVAVLLIAVLLKPAWLLALGSAAIAAIVLGGDYLHLRRGYVPGDALVENLILASAALVILIGAAR